MPAGPERICSRSQSWLATQRTAAALALGAGPDAPGERLVEMAAVGDLEQERAEARARSSPSRDRRRGRRCWSRARRRRGRSRRRGRRSARPRRLRRRRRRAPRSGSRGRIRAGERRGEAAAACRRTARIVVVPLRVGGEPAAVAGQGMAASGGVEHLVVEGGAVVEAEERERGSRLRREADVEQRLVALALVDRGRVAAGPDRLAEPAQRRPGGWRSTKSCQAGSSRAGLRPRLSTSANSIPSASAGRRAAARCARGRGRRASAPPPRAPGRGRRAPTEEAVGVVVEGELVDEARMPDGHWTTN